MIRLALSKGRILKQVLPMLKQVGICAIDDPFESRKLILDTNHSDIQFVVIRATDVPTYVQFGAADIGVVGKDGLMEHGGEGLCELLDLKIAQCRLMTAVPKAIKVTQSNNKCLRVASKYVNLTKQFYQSQGLQVEVIRLYGSMELAPLVGLADEIVDLVETGNTLKANNLVEKDLIASISCRLIANAAALRVKHEAILELVQQLETLIVTD